MTSRNPWAGRIGRSVRQAQRPDTAAEIDERARRIKACDQARQEREQKFPTLTPENAAEAIRWQEARIHELLSEQNTA